MVFRDRTDAGSRLAAMLAGDPAAQPRSRAVVLALPRGGVPVAEPIAAALRAPLDLMLVRKLGLPGQPELAMGALAEGPEPVIVRNEDVVAAARVSSPQFDAVVARETAEIDRRRTHYLAGRPRVPLAGRSVIVVDDGIATGATMRAALVAVRRQRPAEIVLAVPVAAATTLADLSASVERIVCLDRPEDLGAIGYFYEDFHQVGDEEVIAALRRHPPSVAG